MSQCAGKFEENHHRSFVVFGLPFWVRKPVVSAVPPFLVNRVIINGREEGLWTSRPV